jgi:hypothetical protein
MTLGWIQTTQVETITLNIKQESSGIEKARFDHRCLQTLIDQYSQLKSDELAGRMVGAGDRVPLSTLALLEQMLCQLN